MLLNIFQPQTCGFTHFAFHLTNEASFVLQPSKKNFDPFWIALLFCTEEGGTIIGHEGLKNTKNFFLDDIK